MSVERQYGDIIFTCNTCDDTLETGTSNFDAALSALRQAGWYASKKGDTWIHVCHDCKNSKRQSI